MNIGGNQRFFDSEDEFNDSVSQEIVSSLFHYQSSNDAFNIALSGGNSPVGIFRSLVRLTKEESIDWRKTNFYWIDERGVEPDHQDSNYGSAYTHFLKDNEVGRVHRMEGELDPKVAASNYEAVLRNTLPLNESGIPILDLALVGMGTDGHVASIFPGSQAADSSDLTYGDYIENAKSNRITLTFPTLNAIRKRIFIIKGQEKLDLLEEMANSDSLKYPMQSLLNKNNEDVWFIMR